MRWSETTERNVHLSDQSVAAADRVSNRIHAALTGREEGDESDSRPAQAGLETQSKGEFRYVRI